VTDEVQRSLGRIEGALREIKDAISDISDRLQNHIEDDTKKFDGHDDRIRTVERRQSYWGGAIALLAFFITAVATFFHY
jgi:hypothetical protein